MGRELEKAGREPSYCDAGLTASEGGKEDLMGGFFVRLRKVCKGLMESS